jgi:hypothetical protein
MARWRLSIALAVMALAIAGQAAAQQRPHLTLTDRSPLKVHGTGFHGHERVWVVAHAGAGRRFTRRVTASGSGGFSASLVGRSRPCGHVRISATGSRGSVARLSGLNFPACIVD